MASMLLLAALLAAEPPLRPAVHDSAVTASLPSPAQPAAAPRERSLATIGRAMAIQTIAMQAMLGPVEAEARKSMTLRAHLMKLEARFPGVTDVLIKAIIDDFRARLVKLDAAVEADVESHFGATLSDRTLEVLASLAAIISQAFDEKIPAIAQAPSVDAAKRIDIAKPTQAQLDPIFESLRQEPGGKAALEDLFKVQERYGAMQDRALATMYCETLEPAAKTAMAFLKRRGASPGLITRTAEEMAKSRRMDPKCNAAAQPSPPTSTGRPG